MHMDTFLRLPEEKQNAIIHQGLKEFSQRSYQEANTDVITRECGISKGSLYHYFGSKKEFYLHLVASSLAAYRQAVAGPLPEADFYGLLFASLSRKLRFVKEHPLETAFLAQAAREGNHEVLQEKNILLREAMGAEEASFREVLREAFGKLPLKAGADRDHAFQCVLLYAAAIREDMLKNDRGTPETLPARENEMRLELKQSMDMILYGILGEDAK